ncbi:hypothetical protein FKF97_10170 [Clostridium perfringens]|nr:hypothetical protein [Clostridium perfringens]
MSKMKIFKNILTATLLIIIGLIIGLLINTSSLKSVKANTAAPEATKIQKNDIIPVKVIKVLTKSTDEIKLDKGDIYKEYDNGSWSIENDSTNTYIFQAAELGDWNYILHDRKNFDNLVSTYTSIKDGTY